MDRYIGTSLDRAGTGLLHSVDGNIFWRQSGISYTSVSSIVGSVGKVNPRVPGMDALERKRRRLSRLKPLCS